MGIAVANRDIVAAGDGDDDEFGGKGKDRESGGDGNDFLQGDANRDRLDGGKGNDVLIGGEGKDILNGGRGQDVLLGGTGSDTMTGGLSDDFFIFEDDFGNDRITDFDAASGEIIDLINVTGIEDANDLFANHLAQVGADVVFDDLNGNTLVLESVVLDDLSADNFLFNGPLA